MAIRFKAWHHKPVKYISSHDSRERLFALIAGVLLLCVMMRLAYWQIWKHTILAEQAESQYRRTLQFTGDRGTISTSDGYVLATNQPRYKLFAQPNRLVTDLSTLQAQICPVLAQHERDATTAAEELPPYDCSAVLSKLANTESRWQYLAMQLTEAEKASLSGISDPGIGFEPYSIRMYPEASMAAHVLGFVGKTSQGDDIGYFGLEGLLENELKGKSDSKTVLTDALGYQLTPEGMRSPAQLQGRDIVLTIRRDIQFAAEQALAEAMRKYGAAKGEIIIMEPKTGNILALANAPTFHPGNFIEIDPLLYKNASLNDVYEPGSTLKVLTVAAGINEGIISPDTVCTACAGPRVFGKYTIRTWNNQYTPNITITQALEKSDNTAMIFIAERLGSNRLKEYLEKFRIGQPLGIELQGDTATPFPSKWGPVETATISFGQGIGTTSLQLLRAIATIANDGFLVQPRIVQSIKNEDSLDELPIAFSQEQVISTASAKTVTTMMEAAAEHGEAKWVYAKHFRAAGKTGTSQVAIEGGYDESKTIASFVGFSPPDNPQFVMLIKLVAPQSSPWAAETAAPTWFKLANRLYLLMGIPFESSSNEVSNQY